MSQLAEFGTGDVRVEIFPHREEARADRLILPPWSFGRAWRGVGLDDAGSVTVSGHFPATIKFADAGALVAAGWSPGSSALNDDVFFATLDRGGVLLRSSQLGSTLGDRCTALALDPAGNRALRCGLEAPVNVAGGTLAAGSGLLKLDPLGGLGFALPMPSIKGVEVPGPHSVTFDSAGNVLTCGGYRGSFDFGAGALAASGSFGNPSSSNTTSPACIGSAAALATAPVHTRGRSSLTPRTRS